MSVVEKAIILYREMRLEVEDRKLIGRVKIKRKEEKRIYLFEDNFILKKWAAILSIAGYFCNRHEVRVTGDEHGFHFLYSKLHNIFAQPCNITYTLPFFEEIIVCRTACTARLGSGFVDHETSIDHRMTLSCIESIVIGGILFESNAGVVL